MELWLAMTPLSAQEQMLAIQAAAFHSYSESNRREIIKRLKVDSDQKIAEDYGKKEVSTRELGLIMAGINGR